MKPPRNRCFALDCAIGASVPETPESGQNSSQVGHLRPTTVTTVLNFS